MPRGGGCAGYWAAWPWWWCWPWWSCSLLDPWLRRTLEKQVTEQTQGQYRLQVGELRTSLWQRAVRLQNVRLRPAAQVADTLPRMRLDVARLHVTGIGLLALLRKGVVPIDSVVLDSVRSRGTGIGSKANQKRGPAPAPAAAAAAERP